MVVPVQMVSILSLAHVHQAGLDRLAQQVGLSNNFILNLLIYTYLCYIFSIFLGHKSTSYIYIISMQVTYSLQWQTKSYVLIYPSKFLMSVTLLWKIASHGIDLVQGNMHFQ